MHRTDRFLEKVFFGFDLQCFYLRIDLVPEKMADFSPAISIEVQFASPEECRLALEYTERNAWSCRTIHGLCPIRLPDFAGNRILELGIPLEALGVRASLPRSAFFILVLDNGRELERFPAYGLFIGAYGSMESGSAGMDCLTDDGILYGAVSGRGLLQNRHEELFRIPDREIVR